ncbi:myb/sant-like dna-binding domain [Holotrichia oblita]|uniref:Myb/sant-like dna-binding domain n=1 Tax=Holotrichia oblita TaxID=644536 RepID=A0ACB9SKL6_HOLOL|nr:myb/sant-like dna-binding domain [Holotrichia oblita]
MRVSAEHWNAFLLLAERYLPLITNKYDGSQGRQHLKDLWELVTTTLNGLGYGTKSIEEWRRAVTDWKSKTKLKWSKIQKELSATGGENFKNVKLSDTEERLLNIMGRKSVEGDRIPEIGIDVENKYFGAMDVENVQVTLDSYVRRIVNIFLQSIEIEHNYTVNDISQVASPSNENNISTKSNVETTIQKPRLKCKKRKLPGSQKDSDLKEQLSIMQNETISVLKELNSNLQKIANTFDNFVSVYKKHRSS